jgi:hypothetical protein
VISDCGQVPEGESGVLPGIACCSLTFQALTLPVAEDKPADGDLFPDYVDDLPPGDEHNSIQARMKAAASIRGIGNELFRAGKHAQAAAKYEKVQCPLLLAADRLSSCSVSGILRTSSRRKMSRRTCKQRS